ncbi:DgyrCDS2064 [Dimorphilus gyrociliatus]|uniref:DgyrCDS2064 n=1 Tax=Dimorphilus gyrociliatus TaxID=2664684 RepID=A0A7I8VBY5_9ANNE|nr:DgyrCDS2064 [Dimorphilus gyrociliatus]
MLKPKVLTQVLNQANSGGVRCTLLINSEGALLAYAGFEDRKNDGRTTAALASSIWSCFEKSGRQATQSDNLNVILIECEDGNVAIKRVANLLLCIYSDREVGFGMLKAKAKALAEYLEEPLQKIVTS